MFKKLKSKKAVFATGALICIAYVGANILSNFQNIEKAESAISTAGKTKKDVWLKNRGARSKMVSELKSLHESCHYYGFLTCSTRALSAAAGILSVNNDQVSLLKAKYLYLMAIEEARTIALNPDLTPDAKLNPEDPLSVAYFKYDKFCKQYANQLDPVKKIAAAATPPNTVDSEKLKRQKALSQKKQRLALRRKKEAQAQKAHEKKKAKMMAEIAALQEKSLLQKMALERAHEKAERSIALLKKKSLEEEMKVRRFEARRTRLEKRKKMEAQQQAQQQAEQLVISQKNTQRSLAAKSVEEVEPLKRKKPSRKHVMNSRGHMNLAQMEKSLETTEDDDFMSEEEEILLDQELKALTQKRVRRAARTFTRMGR